VWNFRYQHLLEADLLFSTFQNFKKWKEIKDDRLIEEHKTKVEQKHRQKQAERDKKKDKEKDNMTAYRRWLEHIGFMIYYFSISSKECPLLSYLYFKPRSSLFKFCFVEFHRTYACLCTAGTGGLLTTLTFGV